MSGNKRLIDVKILVDWDPEDVFALERDILYRTKSGRFSLVIYTWSYPVIILGYNQSSDSINIPAAVSAHIPVIRRSTGGTGIVHYQDIGVSLALPMSHPWSRSISGLYRENRDTIAQSLRRLGIDTSIETSGTSQVFSSASVCFLNPGNDGLFYRGKRCTGSAQSRRHYGVLIHSHIHLSMRDDLYSSVFTAESERINEHLTSIPVSWDNREELVYSIVTAFSSRLRMNPVFKNAFSGKKRLNPSSQLELRLSTTPDMNSSPYFTETERCGV